MERTMEEIVNRIKKARNVLILSHMRPDGDAYGSSLALSCVLDYFHIQNQVCIESDAPSNLRFLPGIERVKKQPSGAFDLLITVDCSDEQRLGALEDVFYLAKRQKIDVVNIDHHVSNTRFGKYNFVRECSANCMKDIEREIGVLT